MRVNKLVTAITLFSVAFAFFVITFPNFSFTIPRLPSAFWSQSSSLENFEVLGEVSIVINLTFTALVSFGKLAGDMIRGWIDNETLRVIPPLSESPSFNQESFEGDLEEVARDARYLT